MRTLVRLAATRLGRVTAFLAAVSCAVLASAAAAASARIVIPDDGPAIPPQAVRVAVKDGMAGWQIILIALSAGLVAATAAALLDRAWAANATRHVPSGRLYVSRAWTLGSPQARRRPRERHDHHPRPR